MIGNPFSPGTFEEKSQSGFCFHQIKQKVERIVKNTKVIMVIKRPIYNCDELLRS
jgi:hypothetical protein